MRIFIYVQHLLGVGHLRRALWLAEACIARGHNVLLVSGGPMVFDADPSLRVETLAPIKSRDETFASLVTDRGEPIDEAYKKARCSKLLALFDEVRPDVLITEMFPFGRSQMRFELLPLLDRARLHNPRPLIISSLRDILVSKPLPKLERMRALFDQYYDMALVHSDEEMIPFRASFPLLDGLEDRIIHTGFITAPMLSPTDAAPSNEVLVAAGGGSVGQALFEMAIKAKPLSQAHALQWRLVTGRNGEAFIPDLQRLVGQDDGVIIEGHRADYPALLAGARLSISQAGYNSVMDLLRTRTPAVLVPFETEGEDEQARRAGLLQEAGRARRVLKPTPQRLAQAIDDALAWPVPPMPVKMDGASRSVEILETVWRQRRS